VKAIAVISDLIIQAIIFELEHESLSLSVVRPISSGLEASSVC
jgi:hypothetical protein